MKNICSNGIMPSIITECEPQKKILHLTLKKKWFDMIAAGIKKEEYREIKPYWKKRLIVNSFCPKLIFKKYDVVVFKNGYSKDAPTLTVECLGIHVDYGLSEWGAELKQKYYVIELGDILNKKIID